MTEKRRICVGLFWAYCIVMACLLFGRPGGWAEDYWHQAAANVNLRPLETVARYLRLMTGDYGWALRRHAVVNLVGNVVMFLPLGILPPLLWRGFRPLWRCLLRGFGIVLGVELIQLLTLRGSCDVDDVILNLVGITLGYGLYRCLTKDDRK